MSKGIPEDIATEIANKRTPSSEDQPNNDDETKDEKAKADESKGDDNKKAEKPEPKKGEAAKPKNGQSIAQVAEAANNEDDEDEDEDDDSHDGDDKSKNKKRSHLFKEFIDTKRELKEIKRANKETSRQYTELASAMTELIGVVKDLKGNKTAQKDEIEEFAEEWGLDKDGAKALVNILEKKLSTKLKPIRVEDDDDEDDEEQPTKKVKAKSDDQKEALNARKIELAIEGEYEDFLDSFPQAKDKLNLKAIKRYIIGDDENLNKSFADIVKEMYPGVLANKATVDGGSDVNGGSNDEDKTDFNDPKVLAQLDKNPKLKEKYHEDLVNRVKSIHKS